MMLVLRMKQGRAAEREALVAVRPHASERPVPTQHACMQVLNGPKYPGAVAIEDAATGRCASSASWVNLLGLLLLALVPFSVAFAQAPMHACRCIGLSRQTLKSRETHAKLLGQDSAATGARGGSTGRLRGPRGGCLLYTSDAADE